MNFLENKFKNFGVLPKTAAERRRTEQNRPCKFRGATGAAGRRSGEAGEADCPRNLQGVFCSVLRLSAAVFGKTPKFQIEFPKNSFALSFQKNCLRNQKTFRIPQNGITKLFSGLCLAIFGRACPSHLDNSVFLARGKFLFGGWCFFVWLWVHERSPSRIFCYLQDVVGNIS